MNADHTVTIARDGDVFLVAVVPPVAEFGPRLFETHREARGYAGGIRLARRWPIIDCAESDHV